MYGKTFNSCNVVQKMSYGVVQCCFMFSNVMHYELMSCKVWECEAMSWIVY